MKGSPGVRRQGFTLIEVIIVMAIMSILAGIAMPRLAVGRVMADAADLRTRISSIELAVREAEVVDSRLPEPNSPAGVVPAPLERYLTDDMFVVPIGITIRYAWIDGSAFGSTGQVPGLVLTSSNSGADEVLDALFTQFPETVLRSPTGAVYPFERLAPASSPGQSPSQPDNVPPAQSGGSQSGTQPSGTQPPGTQPSGGTPPTGTPPLDPAAGSNPPIPNECLSGQLPPGQVKQCLAGGGSSSWFRSHGNGGGHGHG